MPIKTRNYHFPQDYKLIDDFLIDHYQPDNRDGNWIEPAWEYMHGHPMLDYSSLEKIGLWEEGGKIVGVVNYESCLGEAFFQFSPGYRYLRNAMLDYAEGNLFDRSQIAAQKRLCVYVNDNDADFLSLTMERGYSRDLEGDRPFARYAISKPFPPIRLPEGFRLLSLADECNWAKVNQVLWRGFNHGDESPGGEAELAARQKMFDTPKARRDLKIAVAAPNGDFVAFCGMFYEPARHYAYVEPVATDPAFRRMGLGKAAVLEGIRRCAALGATVAYVGSDQEFYLSLGFAVIYISQCWVKVW